MCHFWYTVTTCFTSCGSTEDAPAPEDTLHFYRYLRTHVLIEHKQFLLLIDIPIQDKACQITIHQVLTLDIPHRNYSAHYDIKPDTSE